MVRFVLNSQPCARSCLGRLWDKAYIGMRQDRLSSLEIASGVLKDGYCGFFTFPAALHTSQSVVVDKDNMLFTLGTPRSLKQGVCRQARLDRVIQSSTVCLHPHYSQHCIAAELQLYRPTRQTCSFNKRISWAGT